MKKVIVSLAIFTISLIATDFSSMSITELNALRGTVLVSERDAFKAQMQSRLAVMSPEDRSLYRQSRINNLDSSNRAIITKGSVTGASASDSKKQIRARDGSGVGSMMQRANQKASSQMQQRLRDGSCSSSNKGSNKSRKSVH